MEVGGAGGAADRVAMTTVAVTDGTLIVGVAPLTLVTTRELLGVEERSVLLPKPPGAVMRTCSRVMASGSWSSWVDEAIARLALLSSLASISRSEARLGAAILVI